MNKLKEKQFEALRKACENFVEKVDNGRAKSKKSYKEMKEALNIIMSEYRGKVIKVLTKEHGKKVIEFWKGLGVDTLKYDGSVNEYDNNVCIYYGLTYGGMFGNNSKQDVIKFGLEIIELPKEEKEPEYPYKAYVWDKEENLIQKRSIKWVYGKINNLYIISGCEKEELDTSITLCLYKYAELIPQKTTLTKKEIADKFGIDVNNMEIAD